jgi:murein DD-endopeptidase MepM/ murein hydrolase activator NlpD
MGFDIRTNQRENLLVHAAASGYISRVKIEPSGFGRAIYITHPNGYTTLYAHLNAFYPALNDFVINEQYKDEKWEQDIEFPPNQFPVSKGQVIAYSGNTGASQGPHLHFEIRDTKTGNNLNPWLFGFGLPDNISPFIYRLYFYDRRYSTYQTSPQSIVITGGNGRYRTVNDVIELASPDVSFGIAAEDKTVPSSFRFGVYEASVSVDDTLRSAFTLNDINYNATRYLNGSIDYKTKLSGGSYIQHLSRLPGNLSSIFSGTGDGRILLNDTQIHTAEILVKDAAGNTSKLNFKFRWQPSKTKELIFAANSIPLIPGRENSFKVDDIEATFSSTAFYDTVPFTHRSELSNDTKVISAIHHLHDYKVPVHDSFTIRLKPTAPITTFNLDKVIMQVVSKRKIDAVKGTWHNDRMEAKFRDFGIYFDLTLIQSYLIVGSTFGNNSLICIFYSGIIQHISCACIAEIYTGPTAGKVVIIRVKSVSCKCDS